VVGSLVSPFTLAGILRTWRLALLFLGGRVAAFNGPPNACLDGGSAGVVSSELPKREQRSRKKLVHIISHNAPPGLLCGELERESFEFHDSSIAIVSFSFRLARDIAGP
jgi:hypothetical protein